MVRSGLALGRRAGRPCSGPLVSPGVRDIKAGPPSKPTPTPPTLAMLDCLYPTYAWHNSSGSVAFPTMAGTAYRWPPGGGERGAGGRRSAHVCRAVRAASVRVVRYLTMWCDMPAANGSACAICDGLGGLRHHLSHPCRYAPANQRRKVCIWQLLMGRNLLGRCGR